MQAAPQCRGFLVGAAQTPRVVVGGMLLANATGGLFGADEAMAAEESDPVAQDGGFDDSGIDEEF